MPKQKERMTGKPTRKVPKKWMVPSSGKPRRMVIARRMETVKQKETRWATRSDDGSHSTEADDPEERRQYLNLHSRPEHPLEMLPSAESSGWRQRSRRKRERPSFSTSWFVLVPNVMFGVEFFTTDCVTSCMCIIQNRNTTRLLMSL